MKTQDFYYDLPPGLIAQYPLPHRSDSRLLMYDATSETLAHHQFRDLTNLLNPGDLLVLNNSKVIPARLYGKKSTGGKVELLVERQVSEDSFWAHLKASKCPLAGATVYLEENWCLNIVCKQNDLYLCQVNGKVDELLTIFGHIPLPPYITRQDNTLDITRYQTVYAKENGSVAAPTAGLHFDEMMLQDLQEHGVQLAYVTLHVGAGTFRPVRSEYIQDHKMHQEHFSLSEDLCIAVERTRAAGKRVIAVGTTALRTLESAARGGKLTAGDGNTDIFIFPGYEFKICDGLITNFHLPESTLLMLVAAFIGHANTMALYNTAINEQYRFFSYGDASLLWRSRP